MKRILLTSTILTGALAGAAHAQQTFDLGTIVLSSSLTPVELGRTGATVEVLEGADAGGNDTTVIDALTRLPGVSATSNGGLGASSSIQIRGLPGRYVGTRINGIDVANPAGTQSQFNYGGLTAAGIDRIEVLKGSQSALYGSEAIAGVVNITTFRPEKLGFSGEYGVEAGSYGTYSGSLSMGHKSERGEIALTYGYVKSDGFSANAGNVEDDGFDQNTLHLTGAFDATETLTLGAALLYRDGDVDIDRTATNSTGSISTKERGARVYADLETGAVTHTLSYSYFDISRRDPTGFTSRFDGERKQLAYLGSAQLSAATIFNFGLDRTEESFVTSTDRGDEHTNSLQAELLVSPTSELDLSAALRYDDNSDFGGKTTGRVSAVWRPIDDLAFRAVIGSGFRTPSLFERFSSFGDPALSPEESISYELGVERTFAGGFVKATLFYTDIEDLIGFDPNSVACGSGFGCYNQIPGTTTSKGIELSGEYALSQRLTLYGNYTYTDAETDGARLTRTPKHDALVGLDMDLGSSFSAYADLRHVADVVPSAFAPANNKVGDYTLVGAGVSYDISDTAELYLRVENLFDEDYETAGGFNQPGRAAYVGLRASF
ncbi:TonB-dependent receptor plug domain-containing protein [Roseovarius nanhaiticus]|uniref:TonB-dependent receptor plug domain-containing protein n=1 Tax=Roseovarius nanhaiticus TaxID=573024 RepID=UPI0024910E9C|nr:TonB-dependent receptor [Roseovarius nanhaiticus]